MKNKLKRLKIKEKTNITNKTITNQSKRLATVTNKVDNHKDNYKKLFEELVKERFDEVKGLINEINQNDLIYYFIKVILLERD